MFGCYYCSGVHDVDTCVMCVFWMCHAVWHVVCGNHVLSAPKTTFVSSELHCLLTNFYKRNSALLVVSIMLHVFGPTRGPSLSKNNAYLKHKYVCKFNIINLRGHKFYYFVFSFMKHQLLNI
jgi:hypothetical protein